jgi:GAF domain-containing protein/anti-sigma regulatory factor (Ser/Thr protein kinase)
MPRLLVVDDDPHVSRTLVELLALHGFEAERAESAEQGLDRLGQDAFELVLLDVRLPGMSGFEACRKIREAWGASLPIIMLTAYGDVVSVRQGYEAGADDFLQKPVDTVALILKVRASLRLKSLHDQLLASREEAQARARDLALLHEIGRDWSLVTEPEAFSRMATKHLAGLLGSQVCAMTVYERETRTMSPVLPVFGLDDDVARRCHWVVEPHHKSLLSFSSGRPYVSNHAQSDPRLIQELLQIPNFQNVVIVPMRSEGQFMGILVAANKTGGFGDADVQLLSIFAGAAGGFLRSRQVFDRQRQHGARLERLSALAGEMAGVRGRQKLLDLVTTRIQKELDFTSVGVYVPDSDGLLRLAACAGAGESPDPAVSEERRRWALRSATPLSAPLHPAATELSLPVRAGDLALGVLDVMRCPQAPITEEEVSVLGTVAGQLALALQRVDSEAATEHMARQMATLYDLGLETAALRDLRPLFVKAAEAAGRLIRADHTSVFRYEPSTDTLGLFVAWGQDPVGDHVRNPEFQAGEGIAGRVARELVPALVNDVAAHADYVPRANPIERLLCVPLVYYGQTEGAPMLFGVLNATRRPGAPPFTADDLEYVARFASQLAIAVANSMAFEGERERGQQLALVNTLFRAIAGSLSRERILEVAVRRIREAFRYPRVTVLLPDAATGQPRPGAVSAEAWPEGEPGVSADAALFAAAFDEAETAEAAGRVAVPILSGDEVVAVLCVDSGRGRALGRLEVVTLETLADGIGILLRNAELYRALEETNERLVELDRMKSELVNIVAHDFRSPLTGILSYAELLEWKPEAPLSDRVERAQNIIRSATHMSHLVEKTLKTTRLETGQLAFDFALLDVGAKLQEVVTRFPRDETRPLQVELPDHPLPVWADGDRLAEVVENLLSNAKKYAPDGGGIRLFARKERDAVVVGVEDRGVGLSASDRERLFRPFSRVRSARTEHVEGSGLGLYICDRIVRAHGGRFAVESEPGRGSVFSFSLPLFGSTEKAPPPLVLVAAHDGGTRREVKRVAETLGFSTHEVADGVEALEAALRLKPSAVIMDRVLPRLPADQLAVRLKAHARTSAVPLFALASRAEMGDNATLFKAFVPQPLDGEQLAGALEYLSSGG